MKTNIPNKTNETNNTNIKRIYKRTLALRLRELGFDIVKVEPNPYKPHFDVYLFEDTEEFEKGLTKALS